MVQLGSKAVGSIVKLKENGVLVEYLIVHQGKPSSQYDASCDGTWLLRKDIHQKKAWNDKATNVLETSSLDSFLNNTFLNLFEANIKNAIKQAKIPYRKGGGGGTNQTGANGLSRKVFLLSRLEVFGAQYTTTDREDYGSILAYFTPPPLDGKQKRIAYFNGKADFWWLRSPYYNKYTDWNFNGVNYVSYTGDGGETPSNTEFGVRPAVILPKTVLVSDDGAVTTNTAPSVPASISIPSSISGGTTITVSWGASTDAQGNLEGYKVERSTNGGSSWSQIYQGSGRSTTNSVAFGTVSVMYRVKAYDSEGLESGYKTSGQVTVFNNRAPGKPPSITVPVQVEGGKKITVSWAAATDADGNLSGYALERQVAGGAWSQVYKGAALSFADTITKGWATVAYRVRAYDSYNVYSDYVTSPTRTVNNNTAPAISCGNASGSDLGTKNTGFAVAYTVNDVDGNTVKVTEKLDGVVKRTYNATLGQSNSFDVTGSYYMQVLNGRHTLTIEANDGKVTTTHTLYFTKAVHACKISLVNPLPANAQVTVMILSVLSSIPADANYRVMVTNNAKDTSPVWEDATADVRRGVNHLFTNRTAAKGFAFNFILTASRGASGTGGHITSIGGGFE